MYYYLFDTPLSDRKYASVVNRIEFRIVELGINGRMDRLSILKSMRELIDTAVKRGAETIVIVGDDEAIAKAVTIVAQYKVTLGIIPVGDHLAIAEGLGIPKGEAACDVLSKRIVKTIDLGKVNDQFFLFSVKVPAQDVTVECDGNYRVSMLGYPRPFSICNFTPELGTGECNPEDGVLEAIFNEEPKGWLQFKRQQSTRSVFPIRKARIMSSSSSVSLTLDGATIVKTPAVVEVAPRKLRVIVGKERHF